MVWNDNVCYKLLTLLADNIWHGYYDLCGLFCLADDTREKVFTKTLKRALEYNLITARNLRGVKYRKGLQDLEFYLTEKGDKCFSHIKTWRHGSGWVSEYLRLQRVQKKNQLLKQGGLNNGTYS